MHHLWIILLLLGLTHHSYQQNDVDINPLGDSLYPSSSSSSSATLSFSTSTTFSTAQPSSYPTFDSEAVPWSVSLLSNFSRCTIPRVPHLSVEEFQRVYKGRLPIIYSRPLEITKSFRTSTTYSNLLKNYGSYPITLASSNSYSHDKYRTTLREYLTKNMLQSSVPDRSAKDTHYWFGDDMDDFRPLLTTYPLPLDTVKNYGLAVFGCGNQYSGVAFHTHGAAHAEIIHGRKRWYVSSPAYKPLFDGDDTELQWIWEYTAINSSSFAIDPTLPTQNSQILECTIEEGEIIYVPPNWWHATLNLDPYNVFVSVFTLEHLNTTED